MPVPTALEPGGATVALQIAELLGCGGRTLDDMRADHSDKVDGVLRRAIAVGLAMAALLGLFVAAIVFLVAQISGIPFTQSHMNYWLVVVPGAPAVLCLVGAGFVWPWHRSSNGATTTRP